jgi:hypothetical protein
LALSFLMLKLNAHEKAMRIHLVLRTPARCTYMKLQKTETDASEKGDNFFWLWTSLTFLQWRTVIMEINRFQHGTIAKSLHFLPSVSTSARKRPGSAHCKNKIFALRWRDTVPEKENMWSWAKSSSFANRNILHCSHLNLSKFNTTLVTQFLAVIWSQ